MSQEIDLDWPDIIIVGAGFFGATIAERAASQLGLKVQIIEKRSFIAGNAFTYDDAETGISVHKYGSHIFHTNNENLWSYVNSFEKFNTYKHHVWTVHNQEVYPIPINLATISQIWRRTLSPSQAYELIEGEKRSYFTKYTDGVIPDNFENRAISLVGSTLYNALIKGYTEKQWQIDATELPSEIIARLPVRFNFNSKYFDDNYQGIPMRGYTYLVEQMLKHENIRVTCNIDYFDLQRAIPKDKLTVYTGPLDRYFSYSYGELSWRTLDFEIEKISVTDAQGIAVMNYADSGVPYTRIHEFKHLHPERDFESKKTIIMKEYSRIALRQDDPYYPVNSRSDQEKIRSYRRVAEAERNVIFGGRLGTYKYLDMHMAIASAFTVFMNDIKQ